MKITAYSIVAAMIAAQSWADTPPPPPETPISTSYQQTCFDQSITVYFRGDSPEISPSARAALEATLDRLDGCVVAEIHTTALSRDLEASTDMQLLSEARSENVVEAIAATGIWPAKVQTDIVLSRTNNRPDAALEPVAQRVEIELITTLPISS